MTPKVCNQWLKCFDAKKQFQELMNFIELERNWPFNTMYYETVYINLPNFGLLIQANVVNWVLAKMALRLFQRLPCLECKSSFFFWQVKTINKRHRAPSGAQWGASDKGEHWHGHFQGAGDGDWSWLDPRWLHQPPVHLPWARSAEVTLKTVRVWLPEFQFASGNDTRILRHYLAWKWLQNPKYQFNSIPLHWDLFSCRTKSRPEAPCGV